MPKGLKGFQILIEIIGNNISIKNYDYHIVRSFMLKSEC